MKLTIIQVFVLPFYNFNLFLMLGDNVYGDTKRSDLMELKLAYEKQKENFKDLRLNFPFEAIWDDHDYGLNDAGSEYPYKTKSKDLYNIQLSFPPGVDTTLLVCTSPLFI